MHFLRRPTLALLSLAMLFSGVPIATAASVTSSQAISSDIIVPAASTAPEMSPQVIVSEGFEDPYLSSGMSVGPTALTTPVSTAWWGRMSPPSGRAATGSYGLWCAGSVPGYWATYPKNSHGLAALSVPATADYYSTDFSFAYTMPSIGYHDTRSFRVAWFETGDQGSMETVTDFAKTGVNSWLNLEYDLADPTADLNLSRSPMTVEFQWVDRIEYPIGSTPLGTPIYPTVKQGEGPTIDNVVISGYKYGPVRDLSATGVAGAVQLDWASPAGATDSSVADTRSFKYRVWSANAGDSVPTWTEHTPEAGIDATELEVTDIPDGVFRRFVVQVWDESSQSSRGWGEVREATAKSLAARLDLVADSAGVTRIADGDSVSIEYLITNNGDVTLTDVEITDDLSSTVFDSWATLVPGASVLASRTYSPSVDTTLSVSVASAEGASDTVATSISVMHPAMAITVEPATDDVAAGASFDVTYRIENTGDTGLSALEVVNSAAQVLFSGISLAAGETRLLVRTVSPSADVTYTASVAGTYGTSGDTFYGSVSAMATPATVTVWHPSVDIDVSSDLSAVVLGSDAVITYTATNDGDTTLSDVVIRDASAGVLVTVPTLAPSATHAVTRSVTITEDVVISAETTATYGTLGESFGGIVESGTRSVSISVLTPDIDLSLVPSATNLIAGDDVVFEYTVSNSGEVDLTDVELKDETGTVFKTWASLSIGASQVVTRTETPATTGDYSASVTSGGYSANALCSVNVWNPAVAVSVSVSEEEIAAGDTVDVTYHITNTGDLPLTNIELVNGVGAILETGLSVPVGGSINIARTGAPSSSTSYLASVEGAYAVLGGTPSGVVTATAPAPASVTVWHPEISLSVTPLDEPVRVGDTIEITYEVDNPGDLDLHDVTVVDRGVVIGEFLLIPAGGKETTSQSITLSADLTIAAEASGTFGNSDTGLYGELSTDVTGQLDARNPAIQVTVEPVAYEVAVGAPLEVTYTISNSGDTDLFDVEIRDASGLLFDGFSLTKGSSTPKVRILDPSVGTFDLAASAYAQYGAVGTVFSGAVTHTSSVTEVLVRNPAIEMSVSPAVADTLANREMDISYAISNAGDVPLTNVVITDASGQALTPAIMLAVGQERTVTWGLEVNDVDLAHQARVRGSYGSEGEPFSGTVQSDLVATSVRVIDSRISGDSRFATAVKLSEETFSDPLTGERAVVIASGRGWADALPASALAGAVSGPLLLSEPASVPDVVMEEIDRLGATKAYLVGGTAVLTNAVRDQLQNSNIVVDRVAGENRYDTAREVALRVAQKAEIDTVFVATGANFPDALAASSIAAALPAPILLTRADSLPAETVAALQAIRPGRIVVCGGEAVVSAVVKSQLGTSAFGSPEVVRKSGAGRYDTALAIIRYGKELTGVDRPNGVFAATGTNYPDALAGGVLAGVGAGAWRPLMLVDPIDAQTRSPQIAQFIEENPGMDFVTVLGGERAVEESVRSYLLGLL